MTTRAARPKAKSASEPYPYPFRRPVGERSPGRPTRTEAPSLIAATQAGNPAVYNALVRTYQDVAYSVAYRVLGHPDEAADAAQRAFLAAYRALPSFRGGSFKAWLLRIVTNVCYDQLEHKKRYLEASLHNVVKDTDCLTAFGTLAKSPDHRDGPGTTAT
jgi:DNA-directed RNA polymerase specialized sigma24 family protein